jgi:hypothetical protein
MGHPPFAGIILIRFYGYFSAIPFSEKHPGNFAFIIESVHKDIIKILIL